MFEEKRIGRILGEINSYIFTDVRAVPEIYVKKCDYNSYDLIDESSDGWDKYNHDDFGGIDQHAWFKLRITIPDEYAGKIPVLMISTSDYAVSPAGWDALNPQFLAFVNGIAVQSLDINHKEIFLTDAVPGKTYSIDLCGYTGMKGGRLELSAVLAIYEKETEDLYYNINVPFESAKLLPEDDKRRIDIIRYLNNALNLLDLRRPFGKEYYDSITAANQYLENEFYSGYCGEKNITVWSVGHTHIDIAWLWTVRQTREKAARSFSTVIRLMERYPEYRFMSSQPQLYEFIKEDIPELYRRIKDAVAVGRWEPEGAMWLEPDTNLTSGESLVRQILYGKKFFKNEFGIDNEILWLPDVFGLNAALPQIMKKSGLKYMMTTKLGWNEVNHFPYDVFEWEGIDGSRVLSYFTTSRIYDPQKPHGATDYNGDGTPAMIKGTWQNFQQKELTNTVMTTFGYGDGGGGPTRAMLERMKRLEKGIPGCPATKIGSATQFFRQLDNKISGDKRLPVWVGELYLETHRGTYTSMARNKKYNRKCEIMLHNIEFIWSLCNRLGHDEYPKQELDSIWKVLLLNQFHDILPGSAIKEVYDTSTKEYEDITAAGEALICQAEQLIVDGIGCDEPQITVINSCGTRRSGIVEVSSENNLESVGVFDGNDPIPMQCTAEGNWLLYVTNVPAMGYKSFAIRNKPNIIESNLHISRDCLENCFFSVKIDPLSGEITSIYDKIERREVLKENLNANVITAFEDKPGDYDAWNIDSFYSEKSWKIDSVESIEVVESGPIRGGLKIRKRFMDSVIEQTYYVYSDIPRIDFATEIDWHEKTILLKADFPVEVHSDYATYNIQFGNITRPTHMNTSWDRAKFEVSAHRWVDISEGNYGVSLMTDSKYGYDVHDSKIRLTMLKSAVGPNYDCDREKHSFVYSVYPHAGDWKTSNTDIMAEDMNITLRSVITPAKDGNRMPEYSLVSVDDTNIRIDTVKRAEDDKAMVIRCYEYQNKRISTTLRFADTIDKAYECDLTENILSTLNSEENQIHVNFKPYEIKTFKIIFK